MAEVRERPAAAAEEEELGRLLRRIVEQHGDERDVDRSCCSPVEESAEVRQSEEESERKVSAVSMTNSLDPSVDESIEPQQPPPTQCCSSSDEHDCP